MAEVPLAKVPTPPMVALAAWLVPGGGYWLLGQRRRAVTVGVTIVLVFLAGLLLGGVRVVEVPGWGRDGEKITVNARAADGIQPRWVMTVAPLSEVGAKPWSIAQILAGPLGIFSGMLSVIASRPANGVPIGALSHARVNEIAVLYTAVAGMLNLLAAIDSSHKAGRMA